MMHYVHKVIEFGTYVAQMTGILKERPSREDDMLIDRQVIMNPSDNAL